MYNLLKINDKRATGVAPTIVRPERPEAIDPMAVLKMRLARGEIEKAEYEDLVVLISR